jgi:protein TonB
VIGSFQDAALPAWAEGILRVTGDMKLPTRIKTVRPYYTPLALAARVEGPVALEVRIEPDGKVSNARVVRSIPLLDQAALDVVRQWEFEPTLLNSNPIPVLLTVSINYTLK